MWHIREHRSIRRTHRRVPIQVLKKYEIWKDLVFRHGPEKLKEFKGFNDEALSGNHEGYRSSRLDLQYRVIYAVNREIVTVYVIDVSPHKY